MMPFHIMIEIFLRKNWVWSKASETYSRKRNYQTVIRTINHLFVNIMRVNFVRQSFRTVFRHLNQVDGKEMETAGTRKWKILLWFSFVVYYVAISHEMDRSDQRQERVENEGGSIWCGDAWMILPSYMRNKSQKPLGYTDISSLSILLCCILDKILSTILSIFGVVGNVLTRQNNFV